MSLPDEAEPLVGGGDPSSSGFHKNSSPLLPFAEPPLPSSSSSSSLSMSSPPLPCCRSVRFTRWQSFAGVCLYVSMAGTTYAFGVYSELLRTNLGFSQGGIDVVASVGNTGLYLSILGGLLLERFGLQFTVYFGGLLIFLGFGYIWLAVEGYVPADIASVSVFFFVSQFGVCCHVSSAVTTSVRLFPPESRGSAVGLVKGYFGLSSAVLSDFSGGYFSHAKAYFVLFIAVAIPTVGIVGSSLANFLPPHTVPFDFDRRRGVPTTLMPFFYHWMAMFSVLFVIGYSQYAYEFKGWSALLMPTALSVLLLSILLIPGYYGSRFLSAHEWHGVPWPPRPGVGAGAGAGGLGDGYTTGADDAEALREAEKDALEYLEATERRNGAGAGAGGHDSGARGGTGPGHGGAAKHAASGGGRNGSYQQNPQQHHFAAVGESHIVVSSAGFKSADGTGRYAGYGATSSDSPPSLPRLGDGSYMPSKDDLAGIDAGVDAAPPECFYGESIPLSQSIYTWRFWALYVSFLTICGTGLMVIDNINAIADAVGRHPSDFYVSLVSLANGAGRVSAGFACDLLSKYFSRLQLFAAVAILMGIAQSMFAVGSPALLYPSLLLVGYLFGCSVSLVAINTADIFGPRFIATNFGAVDSAPIFGSYVFVTGVVALFFHTNAVDEWGRATCVGPQCFRTAFTVNTCCCLAVACCLAYMHIYTPMERVLRRTREGMSH